MSIYVPCVAINSHGYEHLGLLGKVSHFLDCTEDEGVAELLYDVSSCIRTESATQLRQPQIR